MYVLYMSSNASKHLKLIEGLRFALRWAQTMHRTTLPDLKLTIYLSRRVNTQRAEKLALNYSWTFLKKIKTQICLLQTKIP